MKTIERWTRLLLRDLANWTAARLDDLGDLLNKGTCPDCGAEANLDWCEACHDRRYAPAHVREFRAGGNIVAGRAVAMRDDGTVKVAVPAGRFEFATAAEQERCEELLREARELTAAMERGLDERWKQRHPVVEHEVESGEVISHPDEPYAIRACEICGQPGGH